MRKTLCVCLVLVLCLFATGYAEDAMLDEIPGRFYHLQDSEE